MPRSPLALGYRAFNACLGESMSFAHPAPLDADGIAAWIDALPPEANSGDVYASLEPGGLPNRPLPNPGPGCSLTHKRAAPRSGRRWEDTAMTHASRRGLLAAAGGTLAAPALAQPAPGLPQPPDPLRHARRAGSGVDLLTRLLADVMQRQTGRGFVIDNRVGAASAIGARHAAAQPADGYTLFYGGPNFVILPVMNRAFGEGDRCPHRLRSRHHRRQRPLRPGGEPKGSGPRHRRIRRLAEGQSGRLEFATSGVGATVHLLCDLFRLPDRGPADTMVPYRGDGPAVQAVANGEAQWTIAVSGSTKPFIDPGGCAPWR